MKLFRLFTLLFTGSLLALAACQQVTVQPVTGLPVANQPVPASWNHHSRQYNIPTANAHASGITVGSDGALWFAETGANQIGRLSTDGAITEYPVLTRVRWKTPRALLGWVLMEPFGLVKTGPTNWDESHLTAECPNTIYRQELRRLRRSSAAPMGALWATAVGANAVLRLSTEGKVLTKYPLPKRNSTPAGLVAGPDGAFWFVEKTANQVGRITLDGAVTEYPIPTANGTPIRLTGAPDGALWFNMISASKIGRIDLVGKIAEYEVPGMGPLGLAAGADGTVWFTGYSSGEIGRLTTDGVLTKLSVPTQGAVPYRMVAGPDGNLWFTEQQGNKIGQVKLPQGTAVQATPSARRRSM